MRTFLLTPIACVLALGGPGGPAGSTRDAAQAPASLPNIVLILADDLGWSDLGSYGGEIRTPNLDRLAADGIRFVQFYTNAKCEPTRASLMTGRPWQDVGLHAPAALTMGGALQAAGYATLAVGKWHLSGNPVDRGFDRFFGHLRGTSDYFRGDRSHRLDRRRFRVPPTGFYTTDANADYAIRFVTEARAARPQRPFFLYLAFNAPHAPLQAPAADIAAYRGRFRDGWDRLREARFERQRTLGLMRTRWALPPRPETIPAWDSLSAADRDVEDLRMAIYAAMVSRMDAAIGRVLATLRELGVAENTLVMFLSDNGASPFDRGRSGTLGDPSAYWEYGIGWAHLSNTPFRHYKRNMFNGGIAAPLIVSWPAGIAQRNAITDQPGHVVDLMATVIDVARWPWPPVIGNAPVPALAGRSLRPVFEGRTREAAPLYFQFLDHRAVISGPRKLVSDWGQPWALFDLEADRTEARDIGAAETTRMKELEASWQRWWDARLDQPMGSGGPEPRYVPLGTPVPDRAEAEAEEERLSAPEPPADAGARQRPPRPVPPRR